MSARIYKIDFAAARPPTVQYASPAIIYDFEAERDSRRMFAPIPDGTVLPPIPTEPPYPIDGEEYVDIEFDLESLLNKYDFEGY